MKFLPESIVRIAPFFVSTVTIDVSGCALPFDGMNTRYGWFAACCANSCQVGSNVVVIFKPPSNNVRLRALTLRPSESNCPFAFSSTWRIM